MRCKFCDAALTDREACFKDIDLEYLDCCTFCIKRDNLMIGNYFKNLLSSGKFGDKGVKTLENTNVL